ncbi:hypothetical protein JXC34_03660 [Candidatus Woesearchaeota archaeon]|nr:hypothetical protein [Candidatus Woesearchaeota archaeon]
MAKKKPEKKPAVKTSKPAQKQDKKQVLMRGVGLHLVIYVIIGLLLTLMGIPFVVVFSIIAVMVWGLFVLSYAYYYSK